jgi:hypothetical protein
MVVPELNCCALDSFRLFTVSSPQIEEDPFNGSVTPGQTTVPPNERCTWKDREGARVANFVGKFPRWMSFATPPFFRAILRALDNFYQGLCRASTSYGKGA